MCTGVPVLIKTFFVLPRVLYYLANPTHLWRVCVWVGGGGVKLKACWMRKSYDVNVL